MTDARFPERWLNDRRLQFAAPETFRVFANLLMWQASNRSDGHIPGDALPLIPHASTAEMGALVTAGLLDPDIGGDGWYITPAYLDPQTTRDQLEAADEARRKARDKKRRQRARAAAPRAAVPGDVPRDSTRTGLGQDRSNDQGGLA